MHRLSCQISGTGQATTHGQPSFLGVVVAAGMLLLLMGTAAAAHGKKEV
jgi:hypothetical protein